VHPNPKQYTVLHVPLVADETLQGVGGASRRTYALCEGNASVLDSEYIRPAGVGILGSPLEDGLHPNPGCPHERHGEQTRQYYVGVTERHDPAGGAEEPQHNATQSHSEHHRRADAQQVGERRIAHHAVVRAEGAEPYDVAEKEHAEGHAKRTQDI